MDCGCYFCIDTLKIEGGGGEKLCVLPGLFLSSKQISIGFSLGAHIVYQSYTIELLSYTNNYSPLPDI